MNGERIVGSVYFSLFNNLYFRGGGSHLFTMNTPLFVNGLSEISKLLPPGTTLEITFDMARPEFYLTSNDESTGVFKIEEMFITAK